MTKITAVCDKCGKMVVIQENKFRCKECKAEGEKVCLNG